METNGISIPYTRNTYDIIIKKYIYTEIFSLFVTYLMSTGCSVT